MPNSIRSLVVGGAAGLCVLAGCATPSASSQPPSETQTQESSQHAQPQNLPVDATATADLKDQQGKTVGTVKLRQAPNGVVLRVELEGVAPGEHAMHIHEVGQCEPPFKSAGGHYNPRGHQHGIENPAGKHAGDLPNLHVPESGKLTVEVFTDAVHLGEGVGTVFDADGSSLVIHAGADDYKSDPAGDAGDRAACGVIQRS